MIRYGGNMNFDYMTNSQIAALIIGLVFSVIAVGTTFLSIKYAKRFDSFLKAIPNGPCLFLLGKRGKEGKRDGSFC